MGMTVTADGEFKLAPVGSHLAICIGYVDLGTQRTTYVDSGEKIARKIRILFELCECKGDDGKIITTGKTYTNGLGERTKLREHLQSWRGKAFTPEELKLFDLDNIVGKPCMLTVIHEAKGGGGMKDAIGAITTVYRGVPVPAQVTPSVTFEIAKWDNAKFDKLPPFIQKWILASPEGSAARMRASPGQPSGSRIQSQDPDGIGDGLPF